MAQMTKQDVDNLIRSVVGDVIADFRKEMEDLTKSNQQKWMDQIRSGMPQQVKEEEKGAKAARYIRALAAAKGDPDRAVKIVKDLYRDEVMAKALAESTFADGGAIVPPEYSAELIELLRARAVVRASGTLSVPMPNGTLTMPKQTGAGTASYVGENTNVPKSQQTFGQVQMSAKKLMALTPVSNDLLRDASPSADAIVREDLLTVMSLREDLAFLRDDGTQNTPKGIRYWVNASNVFAATQAGAAATLNEVTADLSKMVRLIEEGNVPMTRMGWVMTPRVKWYLMILRDGNGNLVYAPEMGQGRLMGLPFKTTTQIPNNLGAGTESEIYLADFSQCLIGDNEQLMIEVFQGGAYYDGTNVVSGISTDQTVVRTIARHDFMMRYDIAAAVLTTVKWGA